MADSSFSHDVADMTVKKILRTKAAFDAADLVAIDNNDGTYYIEKGRGFGYQTVSKETYLALLAQSEKPIVVDKHVLSGNV